MTATERDLLALEKKFWTGDTKFYRGNVDDPAWWRSAPKWPAS